MNNALRRRHFRVWLVLAIVLPLLFLLGLAARPEWPSQPGPSPAAPAPPAAAERP